MGQGHISSNLTQEHTNLVHVIEDNYCLHDYCEITRTGKIAQFIHFMKCLTQLVKVFVATMSTKEVF